MKTWIKILIGLALGIITGFVLGPKAQVLNFIGQIFINLLKMLVILLIFTVVISAICNIKEPKRLGRLSLRMLLFVFSTTLIAIGSGIAVALLIKPGEGLDLSIISTGVPAAHSKNLVEFLISIFPSNPFTALAEGNILQVIVFAIFLGLAIVFSKEKGAPFLKVIESLADIMHFLTHMVILFAPLGVFALIAVAVGSIGWKVLPSLFEFLMCNYVACLFQILVVFGFAIKYLARLKAMPFYRGMKDAAVMAFSTCSSSATLPVTIECARRHLGISKEISGFVLAMGSTVNMNGVAIGQTIAAIFVAQAYGLSLTGIQYGILVATVLVSSFGVAGIPGSGLVMMSVLFSAMGIPLEGIALVAGVDRLREMMSTVTNVLGDSVTALYIAKKEHEIDEKTYNRATWLDEI